jgi:radical SAM family uncharacterized protein/radical SAM-linked protein
MPAFEDLVARAEKPSRYLGNEVNAVQKDLSRVAIKCALAYPDFYEVGMSNTGLHILYFLLNDKPDIAAERVFLPGRDLEALLAQTMTPLVTLESKIPVRECDIFGIQLPHELAYTNIVKLIRLARIPLYATARGDADPIVLGGGPGAFGPEPVAPFYDAILLGDAEEAMLDFARVTRETKGAPRLERLRELAKIEGVYVPRLYDVRYERDGTIAAIEPLHGSPPQVRKAVVLDLETAFYPKTAIVPYADTVHNRLGIEVMRGCTVGCRFCQAGMIYRPLRERSPKKILDLAKCGMQSTGFEDVSLLSLDTGDYTLIEPLTKELLDETQKKRIAVSLPSLRAGSLSDQTIGEIKRVRKTGFTIAPEAGTQRLRDVINKNISDEEIFETVDRIAAQGWTSVKLYFMVGFPTERQSDLDGLCDLALKVRSLARRHEKQFEVAVSVGTLVPKPHTPFQWDGQISTEESIKRCRYLVDRLKRHHLAVKYYDPKNSWLEGVFSRGDRRLAPVIAQAELEGCAFDSWTEHYRIETWKRVFREHGIRPEWYLRPRAYDEVLPWDHLDARVGKGFLLADRRKVDQADKRPENATTFDCRDDLCAGCSCCFEGDIRNRLAKYGRDPLGDGRPLPLALTSRIAGGHDFGKKLEDALGSRPRDQAAKAGADAARAILRRRQRPATPGERRWHTTPGAPGEPGPARAFLPENIAREPELAKEELEEGVRPSWKLEPAAQDQRDPRAPRTRSPGNQERSDKHKKGIKAFRYRVRYAKRGSLRFLSHLELLKVVYRAIQRSGLPLRFSEGFHPKPKVAFGPPLPVGVESEAEELELFLDEAFEEAALLETLRRAFPSAQGLEPSHVERIDASRPSLHSELAGARYEVELSALGFLPGSFEHAVRAFSAASELPVEQERNGRERTVDAKAVVSEVESRGQALAFTLRTDQASLKPEEVVALLLTITPEQARRGRYVLVRSIPK